VWKETGRRAKHTIRNPESKHYDPPAPSPLDFPGPNSTWRCGGSRPRTRGRACRDGGKATGGQSQTALPILKRAVLGKGAFIIGGCLFPSSFLLHTAADDAPSMSLTWVTEQVVERVEGQTRSIERRRPWEENKTYRGGDKTPLARPIGWLVAR
jgi:hypothetical protein